MLVNFYPGIPKYILSVLIQFGIQTNRKSQYWLQYSQKVISYSMIDDAIIDHDENFYSVKE